MNSNQEKGLLYEKFIKNIIINKINKPAYFWNECPETILIENNLIHSHNDLRLIRKDMKEGYLHNYKDIGIDIIQMETDNKCSIIQCKNGYLNGLKVEDIAGIMMRTAFLNDNKTYIYYTNSLSRNILYTSKISPLVYNIDCSINLSLLLNNDIDKKIYFIKLPFNNELNEINEISSKIIPYSYQLEAYNKIKYYFQDNNRGILSLPCGCGKTYSSYLISNDYNQIIIISPLKASAYQNLKRYIEYGYDKNKTLLIDSDINGIRDIDYIINYIKNNNTFLISVTYDSMDLISKCLELFDNPLFIIDEFHNLSKGNIIDKSNDINKLLVSNHKILFMSATPRIYDLEYDDIDSEEENLIGEIVYRMDFNVAIKNKYITDYKIWLPSIHENNNKLKEELSIYDIDNEYKNRCIYLYSCIVNNGTRKTIIYCKNINDMNNLIKSFQLLNEFYNIDYDIYSIDCNVDNKNRINIIEKFIKNNDKIQLLFNINILNECIDIDVCDSIYISYPPKNKIKTIQRINRATRIDKRNQFKIANIYIWCDEYEDILETISSIKEYDILLKDKIKINSIDLYNDKNEDNIKLIDKDKILINNFIIGIKEFKFYTWNEKLELVIDYVKEYNILPSQIDKYDEIKKLGKWISHQKINYKNNEWIMKKEWEKFMNDYEELFKTNEELWNENKNKVIDYIKENNKLPSYISKDVEINRLGNWINTQKAKYKNNKEIMKNEEIKKEWERFINEYNKLFKTNEELWYENKNKVIDYFKEYNILPSTIDKDNEIKKLGIWINNQKKNYKNNKEIMKNEEIRKEWEKVMNDYEELFKTNEELWNENKNKVIDYFKENNILPSSHSKYNEIKKLGIWINNQKSNYKNNKQIMKNEEIRKEWEKVINDYKELFKMNQEISNEIIENIYDIEETSSIKSNKSQTIQQLK